MDKHNQKNNKQKYNKVKAYQELNEEISQNKTIARKETTPQPQDYEEIEY